MPPTGNSFLRGTTRKTVLALQLLMILLTAGSIAYAGEAKEALQAKDICSYVLDATNQNRIESIRITSDLDESTTIKIPDEVNESGLLVFKQNLDANNDGKPERVFITSEGTLQLKQLHIFPATEDAPMELRNDRGEVPEQWESDMDFVSLRGATYLIGRNGLNLAYTAHIDPNNTIRPVCRFGQESKSFRKIISSRNDELCKRYLNDEPEAIRYDRPHAVTDASPKMHKTYTATPTDTAALLDINNDGVPRLVVSLEQLTSPPCGDMTFPAVLTPDGTDLDMELTKLLPERQCNSSIFPFTDHGKIYLATAEYRGSDESPSRLRKIDMLERGSIMPLCEYEDRPVNYLLTPEQELNQTAAAIDMGPWVEAISRPGTDAVEVLIKAGYDLNERDNERYRELPLVLAIREERLDILELLLKAGANPNLVSYNDTPLQEALRHGSHKAIEMLLRYGADPSDESHGNYTAISSAVSYDDLTSLRMLLEAGSAITDTAATDAVLVPSDNRYEKLRLLLSFGLDPNRHYARHDFASGMNEESPGVYSLGPEISMRLISKSLMEWARESGDAKTLNILTKARKLPPKVNLIQQLRKADNEINQIYELLMTHLDTQAQTELKRQQRIWLNERDKLCGSACDAEFRLDWLKNAAAREERGKCVLEATRKRTDELTRQLEPQLYLPHEHVAGRSQSDLSKAYWRWSKSFPKGKGPAEDPSGALCSQGQEGPIWFLSGSSSNTPVKRQCTIPTGRPIFFPVLASHAEAVNRQATCGTLQGILNSQTLSATNMQVTLDSKQLTGILSRWRQTTDCFSDGKRIAASDGYWLALKPLPPGRHTIRFSGEITLDQFSQDVSYELLVQ